MIIVNVRRTLLIALSFVLFALPALVLADQHWGAAGDPGFFGGTSQSNQQPLQPSDPGFWGSGPTSGGSSQQNVGSQAPGSSGNVGSQAPGPTPSQGSATLQNPLKAQSITEFLKQIIDILLVFAVPIIVFFIIYAGFLYVTAQGNSEKIQKATKAITWTLIGGVLVLGAWSLITVIQGTVNALR